MASLTVLAALFVLGACQVTVRAEMDARADGSGVVRAAVGLDDDAVRNAGDLAQQLRVDDLRQAGWTVSGPAKESDGLTWLRASKPFDTPSEADVVMRELTGPAGPLRDFVLRQDRSLLKAHTTFSGLVDLSKGLDGFVDDNLRAKLGESFKVDAGAFRFEIAAKLPGTSRTWRPELGQQTPVRLDAEQWRLVPALPAASAVLCAGLAVVLLLRRRRRH